MSILRLGTQRAAFVPENQGDTTKRAAALETRGIRYRYVYAIALHDTDDTPAALELFGALLGTATKNPDVLLALANYSHDAVRIDDALRYANELQKLFPEAPAFRRLYDSP